MTATTGIEGVALLNSGEKGVSSTKNEITVDMDETEKDINVINSGNRKVFIEGLQVDTNKEENKELKENVTKEVDSLESPEEILNYLKKFYANEYNKENQTQFTDENNIKDYQASHKKCANSISKAQYPIMAKIY